MTHDEAIYFLKQVIIHYGEDSSEWDCCEQAIEIAIKSLEDELKARKIIWDSTPDPCKIIQLRKLYPW